jgi:hypothetical protein
MSVQTYSIKRAENIMELRNTYNDLLAEYYTLYKNYLGYKFTNNKGPKQVELKLPVPTFDEVVNDKVTDKKYNIPNAYTASKYKLTGYSDADGSEGRRVLDIIKNNCAANPACKGYSNRGELKSDITKLETSTMAVAADHLRQKLWIKKTTFLKIIPAVTLAKNARERLDVLKSKIDDILKELKENIDTTDLELKDHSEIVDKKRGEILVRNKEIQKQDKDLEAINLKLVSRKRQNEFSLERNKYKKFMLVMLVIANIILLGYFGFLLTKSPGTSL